MGAAGCRCKDGSQSHQKSTARMENPFSRNPLKFFVLSRFHSKQLLRFNFEISYISIVEAITEFGKNKGFGASCLFSGVNCI